MNIELSKRETDVILTALHNRVMQCEEKLESEWIERDPNYKAYMKTERKDLLATIKKICRTENAL